MSLDWRTIRVLEETVMVIDDYETARCFFGEPVAALLFPQSAPPLVSDDEDDDG